MACNCIELTNKTLRDENSVELPLLFRFGGRPNTILIRCEKTEDAKRGTKALNLIATFCPFCGERYESKNAAEDEAVS